MNKPTIPSSPLIGRSQAREYIEWQHYNAHGIALTSLPGEVLSQCHLGYQLAH